MNLIRGRDGEWQAATICNRGYAGSTPTPASNFAAGTEAVTSAPAFNHTQPKLYGSKQTELYRCGCVFQTRSTQQWTNNKKENSAAS